LQRAVAIKVLPLASGGDAERRERFRREALALSRLSHPNICAIHDIGSENGLDYLVMELLDGETLAERLGRGPLALRAALDIALQIAGALDKTHRMGLAHRDLKPGNIMLTRTGAKLLDSGSRVWHSPEVNLRRRP
jgi:serine/threonine protein kinase